MIFELKVLFAILTLNKDNFSQQLVLVEKLDDTKVITTMLYPDRLKGKSDYCF